MGPGEGALFTRTDLVVLRLVPLVWPLETLRLVPCLWNLPEQRFSPFEMNRRRTSPSRDS